MTGWPEIDQSLFQVINSQWTAGWLDTLMPYWRSKFFWAPLYLFGLSFLLLNFKKSSLFFLFLVALTIAFTDVASSQWIKKSVQRKRPCQTEELKSELHLLVRCGGGYSFPSSHASNHFAIATFVAFTLGRFYRFLGPLLFVWAFSIGYGQIYVGLHYPLDVLGGAILGSLIGGMMAFFYQKLDDWQLVPEH